MIADLTTEQENRAYRAVEIARRGKSAGLVYQVLWCERCDTMHGQAIADLEGTDLQCPRGCGYVTLLVERTEGGHE